MHRSRKHKLILFAAVAAVAAIAAVLALALHRSRSRTRSMAESLEVPMGDPVPMEFTKTGIPGKVIEAVEMVVRPPGRVRAALSPYPGPRWVCVVVDGAERLADLDQNMKAEQFPGLVEAGFKPVPVQMTRTTSIYRAVSRRAVPEYSDLRGDRVLVLLCPRSDWPRLALHWPTPPKRRK